MTLPFLLLLESQPEAWLALVPLAPAQEVGLAIGVLLTIAGTVLHWQLPQKRMSAEERVKDGKLTEEQAIRMIRIYSVSAPVLTVAGAAVLIFVLAGYLR